MQNGEPTDHDEPLELVPPKEVKKETPPPEPEPPREETEPAAEETPPVAEEEREEARAKGDEAPSRAGPPPPSLAPLELRRILSWPLLGASPFAFLGGFFLLLIVLVLAWGADWIPWVGTPLRLAIALAGGLWFLAYPGRAILATLDGERGPPPWPALRPDSPAIKEGARLLLVLACYGAPALVWGLVTDSWLWVILWILVVWPLVPAAVLAVSASGQLRDANPVLALRIALAGGRRYLYCLVPVPPFLVARLFIESRYVYGPIFEALAWLALALTAHMLGLLAGESEAVGDRVRGLGSGREQ